MGVCLALCLDKEISEAEMDTDGKTLANCTATLDEIAKAQNLVPAFSSFIVDPESLADDVPDGEMIEETWHASEDGLRVVSALIAALGAPDGSARKSIDRRGGVLTPLWRVLGIKSGMEGKWAEHLLTDLKEMERCLQLAQKVGARFYLLVC